jgi:hypothetical protein
LTARGLARKLFLCKAHTKNTKKNNFFILNTSFFSIFFLLLHVAWTNQLNIILLSYQTTVFPSFFSVFLLLHDLGFWNSKTISLRCFYSLQKATFSFWSCFFSPLETCTIHISLYYYYSYFVTRNLRRVLPLTALLSFFNFFNQATSGVSVIFKEKYAYNNSAPEEAKYAPPPSYPRSYGWNNSISSNKK